MSNPSRRFDPTFVVGLLIAILSILGGLVLEKGQLQDIVQASAALIVVGGTIGAVVVATPKSELLRAVKRVPSVFWPSTDDPVVLLEKLVAYALTARRRGTTMLEAEVEAIPERFLKKAMMLLVDGFTASEMRNLLEMDMIVSAEQADNDARVFEAAGGYAPTIGIVGAVLGLMQVMKHLDNIQDVGRGIAVAFVATIYGVALANLVFLPLASKLRTQTRLAATTREMVVEAVVAIHAGMNPRVLGQMLEPFAFGGSPAKAKEARPTNSAMAYPQARKAT